MYQGDWKCSGCGTSITELPFQPREGGNLLCKDCHGKRRDTQNNRPMHQGDWKCAGCATAITELPFEPRDTSNLMCKACFIAKKRAEEGQAF